MNYELGYYTVNGKKYTSKLLAILDAQQSDADISWYFYQDVFRKANWRQEPENSIDELYKLRALQIREKYDYVIIWASGGADSNNVVRTFLNNNIHIDEIISMAPMNGLNNWNWTTEDRSVANTVSETKFALFPMLDEIKNRSPNTKITISDIFDDMLAFKDDEWLYDSTGHLVGPNPSVFGRLDKFPHLVKLDEQGKKIGNVFGVDKPVVRFWPEHPDEVALFLSDIPSTIPRPCFRHAGHNAERVLFYHSHEMPEIMIKQAHIVAKALFMPDNKPILEAARNNLKTTDTLGTLFTPDRRNRTSAKQIYQRGIVPYIYPTTYTKDLFQCIKVDTESGFFPKNNDWLFELHSNTRLVEMIKSNFMDLYKTLKPKYLNPHRSGFKPFFQAHLIGNISKFESIK